MKEKRRETQELVQEEREKGENQTGRLSATSAWIQLEML